MAPKLKPPLSKYRSRPQKRTGVAPNAETYVSISVNVILGIASKRDRASTEIVNGAIQFAEPRPPVSAAAVPGVSVSKI